MHNKYYYMFFQIIGLILSFAIQFLLVKYIGTENFGIISYLVNASNIIFIISIAGANVWFIRYYNVKEEATFLKSSYMSVYLNFLIIFMIYFFIESNKSLLIQVFMYSFSLINVELYSIKALAQKKIKEYYLYKFFLRFVFVIIFVVILKTYFIKNNIFYFIIFSIYSLPFFFQNLLILLKGPVNLKYVYKKMFSFSFIYIFYGIFSPIFVVLSRFFYGDSFAGLVALVLMMANILNIFSSNFATINMPYFAEDFNNSNMNTIKNMYQESTRIAQYIVIPMTLFVVFSSKNILQIIAPEYAIYWPILVIIVFGQLINNLVGSNGTLMSMTNLHKFDVYNVIIKYSVALIVLFSLKGGYYSIALAISLSEIIINFNKVFVVKSKLGYYPFNRKSLLFVIAFILFGMLINSFSAIFFFDSVIFKIIIVLIINICYGVSIIFFTPFRSDKKFYKDLIKNIFRGGSNESYT